MLLKLNVEPIVWSDDNKKHTQTHIRTPADEVAVPVFCDPPVVFCVTGCELRPDCVFCVLEEWMRSEGTLFL